MQDRYNDCLIHHGRSEEVNPWETLNIDKWKGELEEIADWLDGEQWLQPDLDPQPVVNEEMD